MKLLGLVLAAGLAAAQDPLLWGGLERGPHGVGFRSFVALDASREYGGKARPILFEVWYPASVVEGPGLEYERYLRVPDVPVHPRFRGQLEEFVRGVVADDLFHAKSAAAMKDGEREAFARLMALRTGAHEDAAPAVGPFPVVLYHPGAGGSFEENSVLFEYLASYGYVVVSSAFESPFPKFIANNMGGIERSGPDLDFLAREARRWRYADADKLGAIGHSAGAQNLLLWIGSGKCPARAVVSLDTTLEYSADRYEVHKYMRDAMKKLRPPRIPVLLFAQARLHPNFSPFDDYLRWAPRYEAEAAVLSHADFVAHGYLGRALMGTADGEVVWRSYEEVCRTVRLFLDVSLKGDAGAGRALGEFGASSPVTIRHREGS